MSWLQEPNAFYLGGSGAGSFSAIRRTPSGVFESLGADIAPPGVQVAGRFSNLLPRKKPTKKDIEAARSQLERMNVALPELPCVGP